LNICAEIENVVMEHIREFKRTPHANRKKLFVQAPHEEELEEYFILP
jgi:hypothetical protein